MEAKPKNREVVFEDRDSLITTLSKGKNFQTIKNFFYALLISYIAQEFIVFFLQGKPTSFGFEPLIVGFANLPLGLLVWALLFGSNVMIIPLLRVWAYARTEVLPISLIKRSCDLTALAILIAYYTCCFYVLSAVGRKSHMGYLTAIVLHIENVRLIMQIHAVIRTIVPRVLSYKPHSDQTLELPTVAKYLDFNLLPTLIYKDSYPRRKEIDITFALARFFEMFCMIWLGSFIYEKYYLNIFQHSGLVKVNWTNFLLSSFNNYLSAVFITLFSFFVLLHCWYNGMAELTKFADRQFYGDWWTANDFGEFYRKWHRATQEWLYVYVYKDLKNHITPNSSVLPKVVVPLLSAVVHEYIMLTICEQTFPMLFVILVVTMMPFAFLRIANCNFNVLFHLNCGIAINLTIHFYLMEHYANVNCPPRKDGAFLNFIPRVFTADCHIK